MKKRIVILGAGESGTGAALLAKAKGYDVFVSDFGSIPEPNQQKLQLASVPFESGGHTLSSILNADLIIKSPGISPKTTIVTEVIKAGIDIVDEIEFAARFTKGKIIAITGTNGKTTTTKLTYHLLKDAGLDVAMAGNVGESMAEKLSVTDFDWWVLETSSFQIDGFDQFKPDIAVLLNITPDHLDRYDGRIEDYVASKFSLFKNQSKADKAIVFKDDGLIDDYLNAHPLNAKVCRIAQEEDSDCGAYAIREGIRVILKGQHNLYPSELLSIKGKHNQINAMASILTASLAGIKSKKITESLPKFNSVQHRLESLGSIHGVEFVNDSKATNVDAVYYALESFSRPVVWILGGVDKGNDYAKLDKVSTMVKAIICLGKENEKIKNHFKGRVPVIEETQSMQDAVKMAYNLAKDREVVLLSPACASFDLFKNYEDRGNQFRMGVQLLQREIEFKKLNQ